jgi:hypothetical protein
MHEMNAARGFGLPDAIAQTMTVEIGIGINTGPACVGNVGSAERFNYSAIGDAVNVAARAEAACKNIGYDLVVARSTAEAAPDFALVDAGRIRLKGKAEPVVLMILVGGAEVKASPQFIEFSQRYRLLIEALRDGRGAGTENAMADCRSLAATLDPHLMQFLDRIPQRLDDFRPMPKSRIGLVSGWGVTGPGPIGSVRRGVAESVAGAHESMATLNCRAYWPEPLSQFGDTRALLATFSLKNP